MNNKQHIEDIKKIMSVEEEMIELLPLIDQNRTLLNGWHRQLPGIFRGLKLKPGQTVLDIPCGKGGVSVPLAKKYGVKVIGYDVVEGFVEYANSLAQKHDVSNKCTFKVQDIRKIVKQKNICDLLLWIAPPHLWPTSKETIKALRNCVKSGGLILIADAYLYNPTNIYEDYETLESTNQGYSALGDKILRFFDYKDTLWKEDFNRDRKSTLLALKKAKNDHDKKIIKKYLKTLDQDELSDTKHMGLAIWIIQINK